MTTLARLNIPELRSRNIKIGNAKITQRSFPSGKKNFFRRYRDDVFEVSIEFVEEMEEPLVVLTSDINNKWGEWQDILFDRTGERSFTVHVPLNRCGTYRFKLKYSPNGGKDMFWLKSPYSYLLVDPPAIQNMRLYSMIPTVSGTFADWKDQLHHIKKLNFNTVHLLPITTLDASESPYSAYDLFDVDASYLDPNDSRDGLAQLEDFVETAKQLELRLCFDLVINHIGVTSKVAQERPDWLILDENEPEGVRKAGCWHNNDWIKWEDLALIHYNHPNAAIRKELRDYMKQYVLFWANYANYTGGMIRYDNLHSSHVGFIGEVSRALQEKFPDLMVLAEFFTSEEVFIERVPEWSLSLLQGNAWEYPFTPQFRGYVQRIHEVKDQLKYMLSITSHDTESPAQRFGGVQSTIPRYFVCALCGAGKAGSVQGVEFGVDRKIDFIGRKPKIEFGRAHDFCEQIAKINEIMDSYPVFQQGGNIIFIDEGHEALMGAYRFSQNKDEEEFLLFANMDIHHTHDMWFDLQKFGIKFSYLEDILGDDEKREYTGSHLPIKLGPAEVKVLKLV